MAIFFNFSLTSNHLHPLQVENCDSNSRLVVDEDDNGKFRPERVKPLRCLKASSCISEKLLNFLQLMVLERQFSWNCLKNNTFFQLSPTVSHHHPLQVENCDSNSRLVVDEDDNGKFRIETVKQCSTCIQPF